MSANNNTITKKDFTDITDNAIGFIAKTMSEDTKLCSGWSLFLDHLSLNEADLNNLYDKYKDNHELFFKFLLKKWRSASSPGPEECMTSKLNQILIGASFNNVAGIIERKLVSAPIGPPSIKQRISDSVKARTSGFSSSSSAVFIAAKDGNCEEARKLMDKGIDINVPDVNGRKPVHIAASEGHTDFIEVIKGKCSIKETDVRGWNAAHYAASNNRKNVIAYLKHNGVDVNLPETLWECRKPIHLAASGGHIEVVKELVGLGVHFDEEDGNGQSPIFHAAGANQVPVIQYLASCGGNINKIGKNGIKPIHAAASEGHVDALKYFINEDVRPDELDDQGMPPLYYAIKFDQLNAVTFLVKRGGAKLDKPLLMGLTPIHIAAKEGHVNMLEYLIKATHNRVDVFDARDWTPLCYAKWMGHKPACELLKREGAKVEHANDVRVNL